MLKTIDEENTYRYYLHKSILSDMSYSEFKELIEVNRKSADKSDEEILIDVKKIIDGFNSKIDNEKLD